MFQCRMADEYHQNMKRERPIHVFQPITYVLFNLVDTFSPDEHGIVGFMHEYYTEKLITSLVF